MTTYKCMRCKSEISSEDLEILPGLRCPLCGYRILVKKRPPFIKRVKAD
ncbi:MAG: DNA-directed RNA polymerase subunit P [Candidatus Heimdallarchaeota archaeon]